MYYLVPVAAGDYFALNWWHQKFRSHSSSSAQLPPEEPGFTLRPHVTNAFLDGPKALEVEATWKI